jgi:hypothetical protein
MQPVDVLELHVGYLSVGAEMRADVLFEHRRVVAPGGGAFTLHMLDHKAVCQFSHCWGCPLVRDGGQGVRTAVDFLPEPASLLPGRNCAPIRESADSDAALAPRLCSVIQDEGSSAGSGDAYPEARYGGIVMNLTTS